MSSPNLQRKAASILECVILSGQSIDTIISADIESGLDAVFQQKSLHGEGNASHMICRLVKCAACLFLPLSALPTAKITCNEEMAYLPYVCGFICIYLHIYIENAAETIESYDYMEGKPSQN